MTFSSGSLFLPRAYTKLLDRWEQVDEDLVGRARTCSRCSKQGPRWGGWRTQTPLGPARYHVDLVQKHLEATERHRYRSRPCRRQPWARHVEIAHGAHRFDLECWQHSTTWTKDVTVPDTLALVRGFVDQTLAARPATATVPAQAALGTQTRA